jgi:hypothetical protein
MFLHVCLDVLDATSLLSVWRWIGVDWRLSLYLDIEYCFCHGRLGGY